MAELDSSRLQDILLHEFKEINILCKRLMLVNLVPHERLSLV